MEIYPGERLDLIAANKEVSEAVTPIVGGMCGFRICLRPHIPDPTAPRTPELGKDGFIADSPSFFTTPTTIQVLKYASAVAQSVLWIFEENRRDRGFEFSGDICIYFHGLMSLSAER